MAKQVILIVLISVVAILFQTELSHLLDILVMIHNFIGRQLHVIFSDDTVGSMIQNLISLLILPCLGGAVVASVFWLVKRVAMPHIMGVVWVMWLVLLTTMVAQTGLSTSSSASVKLMHQNHAQKN